MGLRGPGAARARAAREQAAELARDLPWEKAGLTRAQRVVAFLEFLPVTKGHRVGENMVLLPKQRRFVRRVYGGLCAAFMAGLRKIVFALRSKVNLAATEKRVWLPGWRSAT